MDLIEKGLEKGLIKFDADRNFITYVQQNKKRNYNNPEEKVQAETFLTLALVYGYPVNRIKQFVSVQMGSETKEADIIVYSDDECEETYILVECKKEDITDQEFNIAVDQAYSYAVPEGAKYVWTTSRIKNQYYEVPAKKPKSRIEIPDIPQFGVTKLAPYKYVKGGLSQTFSEGESENESGAKQKFFELQVVNESELTKVFIQSHQALWGGGQRNPSVAFDELDKLIFCKIWDEKTPRKNGDPYEFQIFRDEDPEDLLKRIKKIYAIGEKEAPEVFKDGIALSAQETLTIVKYFQRINLNKTDLDSKGKAFETFMGSYFRGDFGQYFTPRPIVKFIIDSLPITHKSRVLDTSCGSGGFLLYALDKVREQASEFYDPITEEKDHYKHWHDFAEKNLFGIEINDQIARTAKMNMIIHDDGHTNVIALDGLLSEAELQAKSGNKEFRYNSFDFIVTNPPFGSSIKQTEKAYMHQYDLAKKEIDWLSITSSGKTSLRDTQSTEVLFLEQCHNFLVEHGYLAIVLPDGILTNSSMQYVRDNIEEMYRIVAVVSMPQTAFTATGAGVKSSVLFLRKHKASVTEKISNLKAKLKEKVKTDNNFVATVEQWEKAKNDAIKKLEDEAKAKNPKASKKEIGELIKDEKSKLQQEFTDRVNALREELIEKYFAEKQSKLDDYPIFMAIAEDIGYDATGRSTNNNELIEIGKELSKFIAHINKTEK
ncbi:MAG: restriction endonuclease subunit M [Chloroflexi bacterium]|nr:restriction endonuclease subunit M [Chloroflexota bacterium]NOG74921.1 restriction endonuclease subunit M [Chloroflexota bacterium]